DRERGDSASGVFQMSNDLRMCRQRSRKAQAYADGEYKRQHQHDYPKQRGAPEPFTWPHLAQCRPKDANRILFFATGPILFLGACLKSLTIAFPTYWKRGP